MSTVQTWNMPEGYHVRSVTPESFERDLMRGPLRLASRITEGLMPYIENGERTFFVAETDRSEELVGRVGVNWMGSVNPATREHTGAMPNLAFMRVLEKYRGKGIGTAFIRGVLAGARAVGFPGVFLTVESSNNRAQALYEREGFRVVAALGEIATKEDILQPDGTFRTIDIRSKVMTHTFSD